MKIKINNRALARWRGRMLKRYSYVRPATVATLNYVGEKTVTRMVQQVAAQSGMPEEVVRRYFVISPATPTKLRYEIDATAAMSRALDNRPMDKRARREFPGSDKDTFFKQGELVNIADMGDDRVCEICTEAVENGPYTIEEARAMIPLHPNCRCIVEPTEKRRTAPIEFRQNPDFRARAMASAGEALGPEVMSELLTKMREELHTAMRRA